MLRTSSSRRMLSGLLALFSVLAVVGSLGARPSADAAPPQDGQAGSGGPAVAHYAGAKVVSSKKAPDARLYRVGADAIEPTLGITKKGHIFYTAAGAGVELMRSRDGGGTWENTSPRLPTGQKTHVVTLDPYVYVSEATGRIFNIDLTVACSFLSYSDDDGETWVDNPLACGRPVNDHQTLFSGPPAISPTTVYDEIVYYCWNDFSAGSSCSKSLDGGISWTVTGSPAFTGYDPNGEGQGFDNLCGGFHGHGVVGADGTVYLPKEYCGQPWLGISTDEGATWQRVQVADNGTERLGSDTSIAVDKKGNLYYTYESEDQRLWLVTSKDGGQTWTSPKMVGAPKVNEVTLPTLDVRGPGKVAIGYVGTENSPYKKCGPNCSNADYAKAKWNGYITITANALSDKPLFYSAAVNDKRDPIWRGRCDFSNRCGPLLDFMDIEISPDGTPYAAFVDACGPVCIEGTTNEMQQGIVGRLVGGPSLR